MAKCTKCGKSGLALKLNAYGLCFDCQTAVSDAQAAEIKLLQGELEQLRSFHSEYSVIPDAKIEAQTILNQAKAEVDRIRFDVQMLEDTKEQITSERIKLEEEKYQKIKEDCAFAVAETNAHIASIFAAAAKDFHNLAKEKAADAAKHVYADDAHQCTRLTPASFKSAAKHGYVVFDLETTGLSRRHDRIIEIGAIKYDGSCSEIDRFSTFVNPKRHIPDEASAINHITDDMVADAPTIDTVLPQFIEFVGSLPIIAHNAAFDTEFLEHSAERCSLGLKMRYGDSLQMCRKAFDLPNYRLATVAEYLRVQPINAHRAVGDCETLGAIIAYLLHS